MLPSVDARHEYDLESPCHRSSFGLSRSRRRYAHRYRRLSNFYRTEKSRSIEPTLADTPMDYEIAAENRPRQLWRSVTLLIFVLACGYASRRYSHYLPLLIRKRTGDALWASAVFMLVAIVRPRWSTLAVTITALAISYSIEFSQIYHRPWIDHIRSYAIGKLILGTTFFWWDQVAYTIGIGFLVPVDRWLTRRGQLKNK